MLQSVDYITIIYSTDLFSVDFADTEVEAFRMREVETAHGGGRVHS